MLASTLTNPTDEEVIEMIFSQAGPYSGHEAWLSEFEDRFTAFFKKEATKLELSESTMKVAAVDGGWTFLSRLVRQVETTLATAEQREMDLPSMMVVMREVDVFLWGVDMSLSMNFNWNPDGVYDTIFEACQLQQRTWELICREVWSADPMVHNPRCSPAAAIQALDCIQAGGSIDPTKTLITAAHCGLQNC